MVSCRCVFVCALWSMATNGRCHLQEQVPTGTGHRILRESARGWFQNTTRCSQHLTTEINLFFLTRQADPNFAIACTNLAVALTDLGTKVMLLSIFDMSVDLWNCGSHSPQVSVGLRSRFCLSPFVGVRLFHNAFCFVLSVEVRGQNPVCHSALQTRAVLQFQVFACVVQFGRCASACSLLFSHPSNTLIRYSH